MAATSMTPKYLEKLCVQHEGYRTAELNDKLYLHYKGFSKIENLEPYTGLRVLWLEGNALTSLEGLSAQRELRSLFVQENLLEDLRGLEACGELLTLNAAQNMLTRVPRLVECCPKLETLNLGHNRIEKLADLAAVQELPALSVLDLQENQLEYEEGLVEFFGRMPSLRVLYLHGNPCVRDIRHYRRVMIVACRQLRFLDDRPVFDDERLRCEAWQRAMDATGGDVKAAAAAEREEVERQRQEKADRDERNFQAFEEMVRNARTEREDKVRVAAMLETLEAAGPVTHPVSAAVAAPTIRAALAAAAEASAAHATASDEAGKDADAAAAADADEDADVQREVRRALDGATAEGKDDDEEGEDRERRATRAVDAAADAAATAHVPSPVGADAPAVLLPSLSNMDRVVIAAHRAGMNPFAPGERILHAVEDLEPGAAAAEAEADTTSATAPTEPARPPTDVDELD